MIAKHSKGWLELQERQKRIKFFDYILRAFSIASKVEREELDNNFPICKSCRERYAPAAGYFGQDGKFICHECQKDVYD